MASDHAATSCIKDLPSLSNSWLAIVYQSLSSPASKPGNHFSCLSFFLFCFHLLYICIRLRGVLALLVASRRQDVWEIFARVSIGLVLQAASFIFSFIVTLVGRKSTVLSLLLPWARTSNFLFFVWKLYRRRQYHRWYYRVYPRHMTRSAETTHKTFL